jgi:uncharacterized protein (TIGR02145 family)
MKPFSVLLVALGVFLFASCQKEIPNNKSFRDKRDGKIYETIEIGSQIWMAENLAYLPFVSPSSDGSDYSPYYYVYGYEGTSVREAKDRPNYTTYGVLYNWEAAMTACPKGWHLPSDAEWTDLRRYLTNNGFGYEGRGDDIAKSMASTSGWACSSYVYAPGNNQVTNNSSGFNALPGGFRSFKWGFLGLGENANFWSSTVHEDYSLSWGLNNYTDDLDEDEDYHIHGFSVRCLKD